MTPRRELADRLHSFAIRLLRRAREADRESGIGPAQLSSLSVLAFADELSLQQLARAEQVSLPTISRIAASLEKARLIERKIDAADRRRSLVRLTDAGRRLFETARARRIALVEESIAGIRPETAQALQKALEELLGESWRPSSG